MKQKSYFLPLNGADFDQGGSCSWSPGGQLAATPWPLPTAPWPPPPNWLPWPRHPLTNEASPALPSANQSGWSLASDWLHQWEGLIAGLEQELLTGTGGWVPLTMPGPTPLAATTGIHKSPPKRGWPCAFLSLSFGLWRYCALGQSPVEKVWLELGLMISWTWSCWWYVLNFRTKYRVKIGKIHI